MHGEPPGVVGDLPVEVLESGGDRPTVSERGSDLWHDVLLPHLRRHRVPWLAAAGAVVAGASLVLWWHGRPPALDPVVRVRFLAEPVAQGQGQLGIGDLYEPSTLPRGMAADYAVAVDAPADVVDVVQVEGPGLVPVQASAGRARHGRATSVTLAASADCGGPGWWAARDGDYRVRVRRTDEAGRMLEADVPLAAPDARAWREVVQRQCLFGVLSGATLDRWSARPDVPAGRVLLSARVANPASRPVFLQFHFPVRSGTDDPPVVEVPAHGTATLTSAWPAGLCGAFPRDLLALFGSHDDPTDVVLVRAGVGAFGAPSADDGGDPYQNSVPIPHGTWVRVQHLLDRACASALGRV